MPVSVSRVCWNRLSTASLEGQRSDEGQSNWNWQKNDMRALHCGVKHIDKRLLKLQIQSFHSNASQHVIGVLELVVKCIPWRSSTRWRTQLLKLNVNMKSGFVHINLKLFSSKIKIFHYNTSQHIKDGLESVVNCIPWRRRIWWSFKPRSVLLSSNKNQSKEKMTSITTRRVATTTTTMITTTNSKTAAEILEQSYDINLNE